MSAVAKSNGNNLVKMSEKWRDDQTEAALPSDDEDEEAV